MYVEHWIPTQVRHPYPVVLIHGGYGQGSEWICTPDGRRGWASLLIEQGYKVYVIDRSGQGRNPYYPFLHGLFDREAQTFERVAKTVAGSTWPGAGDATDPAVVQYVASLGQRMRNDSLTQNVWRTRGAMLLDDIGPAILVTHGDGAVFARVTAQARPDLVLGIVTLEPAGVDRLNDVPVPKMPVMTVSNGVMIHLARTNREALQPVLEWMDSNITKGAPAVITPAADPHPNRESTALKLADQGAFWVGVQRKKMPYGEIALGQMFVQYMIPAERKHRYPVVCVHGGGGQGTHMMGIGGRNVATCALPAWRSREYCRRALRGAAYVPRAGHCDRPKLTQQPSLEPAAGRRATTK